MSRRRGRDKSDGLPADGQLSLVTASTPELTAEVAAGTQAGGTPEEVAGASEDGAPSESERAADIEASEPLTPDRLAERVHQRLPKKKREVASLELVRSVVARVDLSEPAARPAAPNLRVDRLRFLGEKTLAEGDAHPIAYDQVFGPGVNVVLVPENGAGKSSILKTIKFALTGDDGDYDNDVRSWIRTVWLHFSLGEAPFTVHVDRAKDGLHGYLAQGHSMDPAEGAEGRAGVIEVFRSAADAQAQLHRFFLRRLGLAELSWTQSTVSGAEERSATWRTYFQALVMPAGSEEYLLLDAEHAMGNQAGLIFSAFLGLRLAEPINELLVERQKAKKESKLTDEERARYEADIKAFDAERASVEQELRGLDEAQRARRAALLSNPTSRRIQELYGEQGVRTAELIHLQRQRDNLATEARRLRGQARALREAVTLRLHFTGLEVSLCPNCDAGVEDTEVERERAEHRCRLCGKHGAPASEGDVEAMELEAQGYEARAEQLGAERTSVNTQITRVEQVIAALEAEVAQAQAVQQRGPEYALPTPQEDARRAELQQKLGELRARTALAHDALARSQIGTDDAELRMELQQRVREVLREEAERLNVDVLSHLGRLVQDMARRIGAESVTDVTVSSLGTVTLKKNGVKVAFGSIRNPGDRLRVKLALFLAIMRLGRVENAGRHPGFLMIDQPGSDEMVDADFEALARVLREIDAELGGELQVLCFTAREQFAAAAPEKVYGPTAGKYAF